MIAYDTSLYNDTSATSQSFSYTVSSLVNSLILYGFFAGSTGLTFAPTYNSIAMTQLLADDVGSSQMQLWGLIAPATGSNTLAMTWGGSSIRVRGTASSYTGVKQTGFPDANLLSRDTTSVSSYTGTITTVAATTWVAFWGFILGGGSTPVASTNLTNRNTNSPQIFGDSNRAVAAGAFAQTMTWTGADTDHRILQVSFIDDGLGGAISYKSLLGVGQA